MQYSDINVSSRLKTLQLMVSHEVGRNSITSNAYADENRLLLDYSRWINVCSEKIDTLKFCNLIWHAKCFFIFYKQNTSLRNKNKTRT